MNIGPSPELHLAWGGATHIGRVRSINQDALHAEAGLFTVADGMGGAQGGEVAAQMAVAELARSRRRTLDELMAAIRKANRQIFHEAERQPNLAGMGTTVVSLAVVDGETAPSVALANVGDSRAYRWRDGALEQLTLDHNYVAEMVRRGEISETDAMVHPYRNMLTRAVGVEPEVMVDGRLESMAPGDRFVLCSDGLSNELSGDTIGAVLRRLANPTEAARELVRLANEAGGRDNVTAIVIDVHDRSTDEAPGVPPGVGETAGAATAATAAAAGPTGTTDAGTGAVGLASGAGIDAGRQADPYPGRTPGTDIDQRAGIGSWAPAGSITRTALFSLAVVGVLAIAAGLVGWYARGAYYVAFSGDEVTIFQGRPDSVLWFSPTLEEGTSIHRDELTPASLDAVDNIYETASLDGARDFVSRLALRDGATATSPGQGEGSSPGTSTPASTPGAGSPVTSAPGGGTAPGAGAAVTTTSAP